MPESSNITAGANLPLAAVPGQPQTGLEFESDLTQLRSLQALIENLNATYQPLVRTFTVRTSAAAIPSSEMVTLGDCTAAAFTLTLPKASEFTGKTLPVRKVDTGANNLTFAAQSPELIDGAGTLVLTAASPRATLFSTGYSWVTL